MENLKRYLSGTSCPFLFFPSPLSPLPSQVKNAGKRREEKPERRIQSPNLRLLLIFLSINLLITLPNFDSIAIQSNPIQSNRDMDESSAAASNVARAIAAALDWSSSPESRKAAVSYLESVRFPHSSALLLISALCVIYHLINIRVQERIMVMLPTAECFSFFPIRVSGFSLD